VFNFAEPAHELRKGSARDTIRQQEIDVFLLSEGG
jgi:hypothetical protein